VPHSAYASVLTAKRTFELREVPIPEVGPDDGILRMECAGLCGTDYEQYDGHFIGTIHGQLPMTLGHELMGFVEKLGPEAAKRWGVKEGDRVIVETSIPCGECLACRDGRPIFCSENMGYGIRIGFDREPHLWGGYASHLYLHPNARMHKVPEQIPTGPMSLFNPLSNAVRWAWKKPNLKPGQTIVVEGPGQRGLLAVAVAKKMGAGKIICTGTDKDKYRLELAKTLGADATIDVTKEDPVSRVIEETGGEKADIVLDVSMGATDPILQGIEMLKKGGTFVNAGVKTHNAVTNFFTDKLLFNEISFLGVLSSDWEDTAEAVNILTDEWKELAPLSTHSFPLSQAETAVKMLGREVDDGTESIHIHLDTMAEP
jgi:threonine dehydrogenase-like Zn-dependent dehydrogenase